MTPTLAEITRQLLQSYNRRPRKRLGQHFLIDPQVVERIITAAQLTKADLVIEIGSGLGVVTAEIAKLAGRVIAIEIDKELAKISQDVLTPLPNVKVITGDVLEINWPALLEPETKSLGSNKVKVIGNLPYYITAPIIEKLLEPRIFPPWRDPEALYNTEIGTFAGSFVSLAVLMIQKEVAERMAASPGSKKYGSFSVFTQFYARVKIESLVSKSSFQPWPEVSSAIVSLIPHSSPLFPGLNENLFFEIVHAAFQQRRKKLKNSLAKYNLAGLEFDFNRRPETLSVAEFARLAKLIYR